MGGKLITPSHYGSEEQENTPCDSVEVMHVYSTQHGIAVMKMHSACHSL